jgi:metal transporter CNNM
VAARESCRASSGIVGANYVRSEQKAYANKIKPIRKDGHLLLVTLLLANMIVNESLPVISDPVLGGGVQSVVVSTVLIVM